MTKKKQIDWRIVVTGLLCITGIEVYALSLGVNGVMLSAVLVVIAAATGISIPNPITTK